MARNLPPPPLPNPNVNDYAWRDWFRQLRGQWSDLGEVLWTNIDFTGSNLTDIVSRAHNNLQSIQGGTAGEYYHLTSAQHTLLENGGAVGTYLRGAGVTSDPIWSTLILPNAATNTYIPYATSSNTWGESANLTFDGTTLNVTGFNNTGSTVLGNAAGDTYSITAGTWTIGSTYVATQALGTAVAGTTIAQQNDVTYTGHSGGTTHIIGQRFDVASQGANAIANSYALQARATHSGSTTITGLQLGFLGQASLASTGNVATGIGVAGIISGGGSGIMTVGASLAALSPILTSATVTTINGLRVQDLGHATRTGTVVGVELLNQTSGSVPLVAGVRSAITSGTARWFLYDTGGANSALTGNLRIGSTTAPTVALDVTGDAIISGNSTWGDAAADTLTINAGTWTLGNDYTATRTAGTVAAGTVTHQNNVTTYTGDSGGTTTDRGYSFTVTGSGANAVARQDPITVFNAWSASTTLTVGNCFAATGQVTSTGNATNFRGYVSALSLTSSGGVTLGNGYLANSPTLSSTGTIATNIGFSCADQGHATRVTNARGFSCADFTASVTEAIAFRSAMNSGTGKLAFASLGTANSVHQGSVRFGSSVAPTKTLDVTGSFGVSGTATMSSITTVASAGLTMTSLAGATPGSVSFYAGDSTASGGYGADIAIGSGSANTGAGTAGPIAFYAGTATGAGGIGGNIDFYPGAGGAGGTNGATTFYDTAASQIVQIGGASATLDVTGSLRTSGNVTMGNANTDAHTVNGTLKLQAYTVATLPAAGTAGRIAYVTDALAPAYLVAIAGGGAIVTPVFDNGVNWVAH